MMKQLAWFRLGAHALRVEAGRRQGELWESRTCLVGVHGVGAHVVLVLVDV